MTGKPPVEKEPVDMVHQNAIRVEAIKKELRTQKLYTSFNINPHTKFHSLAGKPNSRFSDLDGKEDKQFIKLIGQKLLEPRKKYTYPQTESQEIGWMSTPLISSDRSDRRLNFHRHCDEITKFMDLYWRQKEQSDEKPRKS
ncbi:protein FAM183A [Callorhinchus milii]|uniref:Cilia and flagella associated protein 144 n=1 Tax=Callorhinchus milii TaxID=7868 RepID=A0A4W3JUJ3_CALMI|nr:protein FAM183A [Callorhinchus milii]|eukprot:gi/632985320/ref/XP_007909614.1/ PREDICTED: protein FAM183A [Callorhinchus milii]